MTHPLIKQAAAILELNDRGAFTVPTHGLYPFQWNWDSCLTALGQAHFDEARAWTEMDTLFDHQWEDGLVPHIVFHEAHDSYYPGPAVWGTNRQTPTSGITQPPVAGFAARRLFDRAKDKTLARERAAALLPKIALWHDWFFRVRDPEGTGLVAITHPWESGRDNSVDWDAALERAPMAHVAPGQRRDLQHANPDHRPTQAQYERYIGLVELFRAEGWDNAKAYGASPFKVVDPGFNAILQRSCADLGDLAEILGLDKAAQDARSKAARCLAGLETLWSEVHGQYLCFDRVGGALVDSPSVGGLLPAFARIPGARAKAIATRLRALGDACRFLTPSHDPAATEFDARRYWRGPAWLIVNYMIADGLRGAGETEIVDRIVGDSLRLIEENGFAEYYDPISGAPCGGDSFTWTAAMVVEFLSMTETAA